MGLSKALDIGSEDRVVARELSPGPPTTRRHSDEEKARAVRLVRRLRPETGLRGGAIQRVAAHLGYGVEIGAAAGQAGRDR